MTNHSRGKALLLAVVFIATGLAFTLAYTQNRSSLSQATVAVASPPQTTASADGIDNLEMSVLMSGTADAGQTAQKIKQANLDWLRPLLLFLLVFAGGWLAARIWISDRGEEREEEATQSSPEELHATERMPPQTEPTTADHKASQDPVRQGDRALARRVERRDKRIGMLKRRIKALKNELAQNAEVYGTKIHRPDDPPRSDEQQLQKHIQAQAAIIAALEDLIRSNRHKWLHRDAMEAQLRTRITELKADLQVTMQLLDQRQQDVS